MNYERPELLEKLSGAYVLGTMATRARPRFARLLTESPAAQRAVARWNEGLAPLSAALPQVAPPPEVWRAIAAKTGATAAAAPAAPARNWWGSLAAGWLRPAIAFSLGMIATSLFVSANAPMFGLHHMDAALPASYVGILSDRQGNAILTAGSHRRGNTIKIKLLQPFAIPAGKVARLWALPRAGAPIPIADVPASGNVVVQLAAPAETLFSNVTTMAVSVESDPAAPAPTAPYMLSGHCVKFW